MSTGITPICGHCGRPVIGMAVYANGIAYHYACTRSPYEEQKFQPIFPKLPEAK